MMRTLIKTIFIAAFILPTYACSDDARLDCEPVSIYDYRSELLQEMKEIGGRVHWLRELFVDDDKNVDGVIFYAEYYRNPTGYVEYMRGVNFSEACFFQLGTNGISFEDLNGFEIKIDSQNLAAHGFPKVELTYDYVDVQSGQVSKRIDIYLYDPEARKYTLGSL